MENIAWKFVEWDVNPLYTLEDAKVYQLRKKVLEGKKLTRDEKDYITREVNGSCYFSGRPIIPYQGWAFDFSPVMKKYLVKRDYDWREYYGCDKTSLRNYFYGKIEKIIEL